MQHVADLRTGIQQRREGSFTSDEGLIEAGRPGEDRSPAGHPLARPVHKPFQEPFPPAHRDGRAAGGRPNLTRGRHLEMPQVVKPAHDGRKQPARPLWFIQFFQEQPEVARTRQLRLPGYPDAGPATAGPAYDISRAPALTAFRADAMDGVRRRPATPGLSLNDADLRRQLEGIMEVSDAGRGC